MFALSNVSKSFGSLQVLKPTTVDAQKTMGIIALASTNALFTPEVRESTRCTCGSGVVHRPR